MPCSLLLQFTLGASPDVKLRWYSVVLFSATEAWFWPGLSMKRRQTRSVGRYDHSLHLAAVSAELGLGCARQRSQQAQAPR